MMWFSNPLVLPTQFIGVHVGQAEGTYVMLLMYPDGSQEAEAFDDEDALVEVAMKLHGELIIRGWQPWPEPARLWVNES